VIKFGLGGNNGRQTISESWRLVTPTRAVMILIALSSLLNSRELCDYSMGITGSTVGWRGVTFGPTM
jgi:hypothetical protein